MASRGTVADRVGGGIGEKIREVLAAGGEGIMLRRIESPHRGGRSNDLLKYKPFDDAEAIVIDTIRVKVNTSAWSVHCG